MSSLGDEGLYSDEELARIEHWAAGRVEGSDHAEAGEGVGTGIAGYARRHASGAVIAGMMTRLGEILEGRPVGDEVAVVREDPGEPDDPSAPVALHFDPTSPTATRVLLRRDDGRHGPGGPQPA